jgi:hypothetical protein
MASLEQWIVHFRNMANSQLPPEAFHTVKPRGGGPTRTFYKILSYKQETVEPQETVGPVKQETVGLAETVGPKRKKIKRKRKL